MAFDTGSNATSDATFVQYQEKPQIKSEPNQIRAPSLSVSSTHSNSNSNSNSVGASSSHSHNRSHHSSRSYSSSNSSSNAHKKRKRTDLFDRYLDEVYRNTKPNSSIWPPTFGNPALEKDWNEKTKKSLLTFQREPKANHYREPNNPIMKLLVRHAIQETDENILRRLRDSVLDLVYSSQSQQMQLQKPKNRRNRNRNHHNNDSNNYRIDPSWYEKLPGPQPHSITRQNLDRLKSYYYWVTEKSDGIRFMLFMHNGPFDAYLIGRKFEFYRITHPFYKTHLSDVNGPSLMDGELILCNKSLWYLAFDCVAYAGKSFSNQPTNVRIGETVKFINKYNTSMPTWAQEHKIKIKNKEIGYPSITLRAKQHYPATKIADLLNKINKSDDGEYYFVNEYRKTKNDGLIFTPQENNFLMSHDPSALVKWKFLEKNTIDLKVKSPFIFRNQLGLYAGGNKQSDVLFASVDMTNYKNVEKFNKLHNEIKALSAMRCGFVDSFIVECAWNFDSFSWETVQNRPDKHIPNFITVCTDTLRVMMDNVTQNELCDACKQTLPQQQPPQQHGHSHTASQHQQQQQHRQRSHNPYNMQQQHHKGPFD